MHTFLVCAYKSPDFAQSEKFFAWSHDRETVTFRNSAHLINTLLQNHNISDSYIQDFDIKKKLTYCTVMDRSISYTHWRFRRHFPLNSVIKYKIYSFCSFLKMIPKFNNTTQYEPIHRPIFSPCGGFQLLAEFFYSFGKKQAFTFFFFLLFLEHFVYIHNSGTFWKKIKLKN